MPNGPTPLIPRGIEKKADRPINYPQVDTLFPFAAIFFLLIKMTFFSSFFPLFIFLLLFFYL